MQGSAGYYYTISGLYLSPYSMWDNPALFAGVCGILLHSIRALVVTICGIPKLYLQGSAELLYSIRALPVAICGITKLYFQGSLCTVVQFAVYSGPVRCVQWSSSLCTVVQFAVYSDPVRCVQWSSSLCTVVEEGSLPLLRYC